MLYQGQPGAWTPADVTIPAHATAWVEVTRLQTTYGMGLFSDLMVGDIHYIPASASPSLRYDHYNGPHGDYALTHSLDPYVQIVKPEDIKRLPVNAGQYQTCPDDDFAYRIFACPSR